jgi:GTP pyrophosphokinase
MLKQNDKKLLDKHRKILTPLFVQIKEKVKAYFSDDETVLLDKAFEMGLKAHLHQQRKSGRPYFEHPLQVANILTELKMDSSSIIAALLHDVVEDTEITVDELKEEFDDSIAALVDGVTKIGMVKFQNKAVRDSENFHKMLLSMAKDIRVIIIKLGDRLHNMRTLKFMPEKKRKYIAQETLEIYAPLAHQFGIATIKDKLEDLSFKHLHPESYEEITQKINESQDSREKHIQATIAPILKDLKALNIEPIIYGRAKSIYSIHHKIVSQGRPFEDIYDLQAIRIIVDNKDQCYTTLGVVHNLYLPVNDRLKDYISWAKKNGYKSLHTTVVGPDSKMVEIQIRTKEMHQMAEDGIAAHWKYKDKAGNAKDALFEYHINWIKDLLKRQREEPDAGDFKEHLKSNLFEEEVIVLTPIGDPITLPLGATPIDFAYAVHTNIGNTCIGAKVNGRIVPLKTELHSGERVEIITSKNQRPNKSWVDFVKTTKARHWIRKISKEEELKKSIQTGEEILNKFFKKHQIDYESDQINQLLKDLKLQNIKNLKRDVGSGKITLKQIKAKLYPEGKKQQNEGTSFFPQFLKRARTNSGILIQGMDDLLVHFSDCCQPLPGDDIIGYTTKGKGISIHLVDCKNVPKLYEEPDRIMQAKWQVETGELYQAPLSIVGEDRRDLLNDITTYLSKRKINIVSSALKAEDMVAKGHLVVEVFDIKELTKIMKAIRKIPGIVSVDRMSKNIQ